MGELLNKLIEKGWKPRGKTGIDERDCFVYMNKGQCIRLHKGIQANNMLCGEYNLRQLVSKESGLWQFVCENNLVNKYADLGPDEEEVYIGKRKNGLDAIDIDGDYIRLDDDYDEYHQDTDYKYWLIESALCNEEDLEQFLLKNIKVKLDLD